MPEWFFFAFNAQHVAKAMLEPTQEAVRKRDLPAQRWVRVTHFAALALLFGWLSAGCNSAAQIPGTPRGIHTVTITGTSGMTTNTVEVKLVVK